MSLKRVAPPALLLLACAALIPAAALGGGHMAAGHSVVLRELRFHPPNLTINRGDSVTWLWRDSGTEHNVTFQGFHSRTMGHGSYTVRFTRSGTFSYHCTIHGSEGMRGRIVVR